MKKVALTVASLTPRQKKTIMIIVFLLGLLQNFNSQMFNVAGTAIVSELSGVEYYTLQFTIFTLVSGITIPLFGNLGDIQGRRLWMGIGTIFFVIGEVVQLVAPSMLVILAGRVLVSVAQGVVSANYLTLIGEISDEKERPMFMVINGAGIGVAQILAPVLSGAFVDTIGWRYVFLFLTVVAAVSMLCVFLFIPTIKTPYMERGERPTPDIAGAATIGIFGLAFLLIFTWGKSKGWTSPTLIVLYIVCVLSLVLFVVAEKKGTNPLMPFQLLKYRGFTLSLIAMLIYGPTAYSFAAYTAQLSVGVMGVSSTMTGSFVSVHALGCLIFSFVWGPTITKLGPRSLKPIQIIALAGLTASLAMFGVIRAETSPIVLYVAMFLTGAFNVALISGYAQLVQREIPREYIGSGTALLQFMMKLGGTLGLTVGGMMWGSSWSNGIGGILSGSGLNEELSAALSNSGTLLDNAGVEALRETAIAAGQDGAFDNAVLAARNLLGSSVGGAYWLCVILLVIAIILTCFIKGNPVKREVETL